MTAIRRLDSDAARSLLDGAKPIARNDDGVSVWRLADGRYLKIFRRRRALSSDLLRPYAQRFVRAAAELRRRGFDTVEVDDLIRLPGNDGAAVVYRGVAGRTLRDRLVEARADPTEHDRIVGLVPVLYARLHEAGVYFRANHFGNIIVRDEGSAALIDVSEARFSSSRLSASVRIRNFKPALRYEIDRNSIARYGPRRFIDEYLDRCPTVAAADKATIRARVAAMLARAVPSSGSADG